MSRRPSPSKSSANLQIARRHELRLAHGAGPRAAHASRSSMSPAVQDLERVEQLAAEERRRAAGSHASVASAANRRPHAAEAAEIRLDAPDRHDDGAAARRTAVATPSSSVLWRANICAPCARRRVTRGDVGFERQHRTRPECGRARGPRGSGSVSVAERLVDDLLADASRERFASRRLEPLGEGGADAVRVCGSRACVGLRRARLPGRDREHAEWRRTRTTAVYTLSWTNGTRGSAGLQSPADDVSAYAASAPCRPAKCG